MVKRGEYLRKWKYVTINMSAYIEPSERLEKTLDNLERAGWLLHTFQIADDIFHLLFASPPYEEKEKQESIKKETS